jgi:hypothetical protein
VGDTIARLNGTNTVGINRIAWNLIPTGTRLGGGRWRRPGADEAEVVSGGGGRRRCIQWSGRRAAATFRISPDSTTPEQPPDVRSPTAQARDLAGAAARGVVPAAGKWREGAGEHVPVETGDYRIVPTPAAKIHAVRACVEHDVRLAQVSVLAY